MSEGIITRRASDIRPLLLDRFRNAAAAYSLRPLTLSGQDNPVVKVRRDSDDAEQDFSPAEINDGSLLTFVGNTASDNGFVTTWYDQSGNGNDATQSTAGSQPKIVSAGSLVVENGKAALDFGALNGSVNMRADSLKDLPLSSFSWFYVRDTHSSEQSSVALIWEGSDDLAFFPYISNSGDLGSRIFWRYLGSATETNSGDISSSQFLFSFNYSDLSNNYKLYRNTTEVVDVNTSGSAGPFSAFEIGGAISNNGSSYGNIVQEFIAYPSDRSSTRQQIESNINNHYGIY